MENVKYKVGDWVFGTSLGISDYNYEKHPVRITKLNSNGFHYDLYSNPNVNYDFKESSWYNFSVITRLATQSEIEAVTGVKEFVLPEKWRILRNKYNFSIINQWALTVSDENFNNANEYVYYKDKKASTTILTSETKEDYKEITFDQFKQYVLKEKVMSKEELLEKARLDYPVGTIFNSVVPLNDGTYVKVTSTGDPYEYTYCDKYKFAIGNRGSGLLYCDGKWAKIISKPETNLKVENLVEKDTFVLPKYWYCELTDESRDILNYWRKNIIKYSDTDCHYRYICERGSGRVTVWGISFQQFLSHVWNGKEYYDSLCSINTNIYNTEKCFNCEHSTNGIDCDIPFCNNSSEYIPKEISPKKKSYIPIYTEPTTVTNVDEVVLIKKVNKVKTIKI